MSLKRKLMLAAMTTTILSGCGTPFGGKHTDINWTADPTAGTITVSDPKIYRREALISERKKERKWLDNLLQQSETIEIKPEIIREIEVISAFSAGLGLTFDPAAGQSFSRTDETNELKQQISLLQLQLQLDQLRRDADIARASFAEQTELANANVTQVGSTDLAAANSPSANAAADAFSSLEKAINSLTGRLDTDVALPKLSNAAASPIDVFRDRQAYRDVLKTARNAASLDEQHDLDGNALLRLNFQATTLPGHDEPNVPGVVQVKLSKPDFGRADRRAIYNGWLSYVNDHINIAKRNGEFVINPTLVAASAAGSFELVEYYFPKGEMKQPDCKGLLIPGETAPDPSKCDSLKFAVPVFSERSPNAGAYTSFAAYISRFDIELDEGQAAAELTQARGLINNQTVVDQLTANCSVNLEMNVRAPDANALAPAPEAILLDAIRVAQTRVVAGSVLIELDRKARLLLRQNRRLTPNVKSNQWAQILNRYSESAFLLASFEKQAFTLDKCGSQDSLARTLNEFRADLDLVEVPQPFFRAIMDEDQGVTVYNVAPREQAQQISTVARSANSLGLALSVAAAKPSAGAAANLGANYVRQASGKAAVVERAPAVVGYSKTSKDPSSRTFGWVLGPQATIHPKGKRLELEQSLKPYDLSADISVPGWWPRIGLEIKTQWAPALVNITNGALSTTGKDIEVRRSINAADYDALTQRLTRLGTPYSRRAELDAIDQTPLSYCKPTTVFVQGSNIWRATSALLLGKKIDGASIEVSPDMAGVFITIPALEGFAPNGAWQDDLTVFTPSGATGGKVNLPRKPQTGCKKEEAKPDPNAIAISTVDPVDVRAGADVKFRVEGTNLDKVTQVLLGGAEVLAVTSRVGKAVLNLQAGANQTKGLGEEATLKFYKDTTKGEPKALVDTKSVRVRSATK